MPAILHTTDLFRPHNDPDDHFDLSTVYALALSGEVHLAGIVIDYPPSPRFEPDVRSVAQLNSMTGLAVPTAIGCATPMVHRSDRVEPIPQERGGVNLILRTLEESRAPVDIHVVGTCRDVAYAINESPDLFTKNCRAIYVNAGLGVQSADADDGEYNVMLDHVAYAHILRAPCPVYWLPCFETMQRPPTVVEQHGTWWDFLQADVLPDLPPRLRAYFDFMLRRDLNNNWLTALAEPNPTYGGRQTERRNMWCTAGLLHSAGYTVTDSGAIVARQAVGEHELVFQFRPVEIDCDARTGVTTWHNSTSPTPSQFLFEVVNRDAYRDSMRLALHRLLALFDDETAHPDRARVLE